MLVLDFFPHHIISAMYRIFVSSLNDHIIPLSKPVLQCNILLFIDFHFVYCYYFLPFASYCAL